MRRLLDIDDLSASQLSEVLNLSAAPAETLPRVLDGEGAALLFEKPSARTRNSMERAVVQLGGHPTYIGPAEVGLDKRESVEDVTRTLACYHRVVTARVFAHSTVERMAATGVVPVVNMLSDAAHPLQAIADILTVRDEFGDDLAGIVVAYVGDANNVAASLALAAASSNMEVRIACPPGYGFDETTTARLGASGCAPSVVEHPEDAVAGAHVVYTDVWTSMGQEAETEQRLAAFAGYTVNEALMARADDRAVFLHCLPAHRGQEVTDAVIDGPSSRVWAQATNRMHAARGLLAALLSDPEGGAS